jgi:hypothetical protein
VQGDSFAFRNYFNLLKSELTPVSFVDNSLDSTLTEAERVEAGDHDAF